MRVLPLLSLVALAACANENELRFTSTLMGEINGVALSDDGLDGFAGVVGTTCTIDTNWGCPTDDADLPTQEDRILDHLGAETLGSSPEGLHIIRGSAWQQDEDVPLAELHTAHLMADGLVSLAGSGADCLLTVGAEQIAAPAVACDDDVAFTFDRDLGEVYAATADGVMRLSLSGATDVSTEGDLVSWDPTLELLYVATTGERELRALRSGGAEVWSVEVRGTITSIATRGTLGEVLALAEDADGFGLMERRDGRTGELLGTSRLPDADAEVVVSDNGATVGMVHELDVNFFAMDEGIDEPVIDPDPPICIDPMSRVSSE